MLLDSGGMRQLFQVSGKANAHFRRKPKAVAIVPESLSSGSDNETGAMVRLVGVSWPAKIQHKK